MTAVKLTQPGSMSPEEFDVVARDLTNFLTYVGEPMQLERHRIGIFTMLFLLLLLIVAWMLPLLIFASS